MAGQHQVGVAAGKHRPGLRLAAGDDEVHHVQQGLAWRPRGGGGGEGGGGGGGAWVGRGPRGKPAAAGGAGRAAGGGRAMERAAGVPLASNSASVLSICAAMSRAVRPPSRAVLRPTRSLAWIAVVPS